ncbi:MAG: cupin domain-containing protein [Methylocella sp.]
MLGVSGNLFDIGAINRREEQFAPLVETQSLKIERIVSHGQASPPGFWFDEEFAEWVAVLAGSAVLRFADEADVRVLAAGDHIFIPARRKHRVEWTDQAHATIWLTVHFPA